MTKKKDLFERFSDDKHQLPGRTVTESIIDELTVGGRLPFLPDQYQHSGKFTHVDMAIARFSSKIRKKFGLDYGIYNIFYSNEKQGELICPENGCQDTLGVINYKIAGVRTTELNLVQITSLAPPELMVMLMETNQRVAICLRHRILAQDKSGKKAKKALEGKPGKLLTLPLPESDKLVQASIVPANDTDMPPRPRK